MGLSYHFKFRAPKSKRPEELVSFLRSVEEEAKRLGFGPTLVLNGMALR